jgi:hypothetical protein
MFECLRRYIHILLDRPVAPSRVAFQPTTTCRARICIPLGRLMSCERCAKSRCEAGRYALHQSGIDFHGY